jgi:crotonobetainyl-CoA:carnitine CoA-transferase CaiB-like acyl-CoA transferase
VPKLSGSPGSVISVAPLHGDHTDEILQSLHFTSEEIDKYRSEGIVG